MKITLHRLVFEKGYTEGQFFIDDFYFCDTLEDRTRDYNKDGDLSEPGEEKVYGETAIPFGEYPVVMSYSNRFKRVLPEIINVLDFQGIRIHSGNTAEDSHGCILVGKYASSGRIAESRKTLETLIRLIEETIKSGRKVTIVIK